SATPTPTAIAEATAKARIFCDRTCERRNMSATFPRRCGAAPRSLGTFSRRRWQGRRNRRFLHHPLKLGVHRLGPARHGTHREAMSLGVLGLEWMLTGHVGGDRPFRPIGNL